jgi:hypothetical protein
MSMREQMISWKKLASVRAATAGADPNADQFLSMTDPAQMKATCALKSAKRNTAVHRPSAGPPSGPTHRHARGNSGQETFRNLASGVGSLATMARNTFMANL